MLHRKSNQLFSESEKGEKVTTTKIRTSKTNQNQKEHQKICKNHHYIESVFLVHHNYDKNQTFDVLILPMASNKITTSKIKISNTYGILPMVTKACGGLG
jgi:hypothetical protein